MGLKHKQNCVDCHFFVTNIKFPNQIESLSKEESERKKARQKDYSWVDTRQGDNAWLACYFNVWHERYNEFDSAKFHKVIVEKDRGDSCFWWPYNPDMLPPAAKILQERDVKNRNAEHDRSLTRRGLRIATIALFINAAALVINAAPKWIELIFFRRQ